MPFNIGIDDEFIYCGVPYIVHSIDPPDISIQRLDGDKKVRTMDFISLISNRDFVVSDNIRKRTYRENTRREGKIISLFENLPEDRREKVLKKYEIIKPILLFEKVKLGDFVSVVMFKENYSELIPENKTLLDLSKTKLIEQIHEKHRISERQIKRYLSSYKQFELESPTRGKDGLISKRHLGMEAREDEHVIEICHPKKKDVILDNLKLRIDKRYGPILKKAIEKNFLNKRRPNISNLKNVIEGMCWQEDLKPLGYDTVYHIIKRLNKKVVNILQNGDQALEEYQLSLGGFVRNAKTPLHIVEIDHTQLDIDVIDEKSGSNLGRPWITMGIDVYSRKIWCLHISFDAPSANKVRKAIEHGLFFKNAKDKYKTINEWEICGIPQIIYVDNGPDFKSADLTRLVNEGLNTQIMFRPVKLPKYGAVIERVFGTINRGFIHDLDGTRKSNPKHLGEYDAEKEAIFTLDNIRDLLTTYIVDVYHHSVHKGLPLEYPTPAAMYYRGIDIFGYPDFVQNDEEEFFKLKLMAQDERKYSNEGIRLDNVIYRSKETSKFITAPKSTYRVRYDLDDISYVYIHDPSNGEYTKIYAQNPPAEDIEGMSRRTYKLILRDLREKGKINLQQIPGSRDIAKGKKHLQDKMNSMMKSNKRMRREALKSGFTLMTTSVDVKKLAESGPNSESKFDLLLEQLNSERNQKGI